ncbi:MAG: hypothetical protein JNM85_04175 [Chthonomonas sp.]|nr:hypothetical protein [Chthonomonas sp.]
MPQKPGVGSPWPNSARCAISLSYDGADYGHLEVVVPLLERLHLHATFLLEPAAALEQLARWQALPALGHELGLMGFEPEGRSFFDEAFGRSANVVAAETPTYSREVAEFVRVPHDGFNFVDTLSPKRLAAVNTDGMDATMLTAVAHRALEEGAWLIFAFEGIGTGEAGIDRADHATLLEWIADRKDEILVAPIGQVGKVVRDPAHPR